MTSLYESDRIRVCAICPSFTNTPLLTQFDSKVHSSFICIFCTYINIKHIFFEAIEIVRTLSGGILRVEDVAKAFVELALDTKNKYKSQQTFDFNLFLQMNFQGRWSNSSNNTTGFSLLVPSTSTIKIMTNLIKANFHLNPNVFEWNRSDFFSNTIKILWKLQEIDEVSNMKDPTIKCSNKRGFGFFSDILGVCLELSFVSLCTKEN